MGAEPLYDFTDENDVDHVVRIVHRYGGHQFAMHVVDVEDIHNGKKFTKVKETDLRVRESE